MDVMNKLKPAEWIQLFHRWSGLCLILLIGIKLLSGFVLSGKIQLLNEKSASWMHFSKWVDLPLLFFFLFHAAYGVLKIAMSKGIQNKDRALILTNVIAGVLFLFMLILLCK
jgi:succinate dehydrogenase/fumarate reductase cytochrome b subunit